MRPMGTSVPAFPLSRSVEDRGHMPRLKDRSKEKSMKRGAIPLLTVLFLVMAAAVPGSCGTAPPMIEKNLFSQDRKPPSPESAAAPPPTNKPAVSPKAFQLDGIIIHGDTRKALVRMKTGGGPVGQKGKSQSPYIVVTEGGLLADYRVTKIDVKSISLEKDGQTIVVTLFAEGKTSPPVPAAPAPFNPAPDGQAVPERGRGHGGPLRGGRPEPGRPGGPSRRQRPRRRGRCPRGCPAGGTAGERPRRGKRGGGRSPALRRDRR